MGTDPSSLQRLKIFMELIRQAKQQNAEPTFVSTPTEHGDNINLVASIEGKPATAGILFWDVSLLQNNGLADTLDEEDLALGLNITDGLVEDAEKILAFVDTELAKLAST
ncbi:hypothetical protein PJI16_18490 [Nitrospira sp. MA-1]|nr:hypothetical protein [Nitrospira sp. MA-1]